MYDATGQTIGFASAAGVSVAYTYDVYGNRVGRTADSGGGSVTAATYLVSGWDPARAGAVGTENFDVWAEAGAEATGWVTRRLYGPGFDAPAAAVGPDDWEGAGGPVTWYVADRQGSIQAALTVSGLIAAQAGYDGTGNLVGGGSVVDQFGYAGMQLDPTTGLYYVRDRIYDPVTGRFLSPDRLSQPPNPYSYVANGFPNGVDPSGMAWTRDEVLAQLARSGRAAIAGWILDGNAILNPVIPAENWIWRNVVDSGKKVEMRSGRVIFDIPEGLSAEEAAEFVRGKVESGTFNSDIHKHYKDWLEDQIHKRIASGRPDQNNETSELQAQYADSIRKETLDLGVGSAQLMKSIYLFPLKTAGLIEAVVDIVDGDADAFTVLNLIPLVQKIPQLRSIKIVGAGGMVKTVSAPDLDKLRAGKIYEVAGFSVRSLCFAPDTLVVTACGLRPIGEVQSGERVLSFDFGSDRWVFADVLARHENLYTGPMVRIRFGDSRIAATAGHPFWVMSGDDLGSRPTPHELPAAAETGGSQAGQWVNSHDLRVGDELLGRDGRRTRVSAVDVWPGESVRVCNLTVRNYHTFAVGSDGALVHNQAWCDLLAKNYGRAKPKVLEQALKDGKFSGIHGHHIVMKGITAEAGAWKEIKKWNDLSAKILEDNKISLLENYKDAEKLATAGGKAHNLCWAGTKAGYGLHGEAYAKAVYERLKAANKGGAEKVKEALDDIAARLEKGEKFW